MTTVTPRRTLTITEAAEALGVNARTMRDHLVEGVIDLGTARLRVIRVGSRVLVPAAELAKVLGESA